MENQYFIPKGTEEFVLNRFSINMMSLSGLKTQLITLQSPGTFVK